MHSSGTNRRTKVRDISPAGQRTCSTKRAATAVRGALVLALFCPLPLLIAARPALAQTETVIYSFPISPDGTFPKGLNPTFTPILDGSGNLYGATTEGGAYSDGTVFKVTPKGKETVRHGFSNKRKDNGFFPAGSLVLDGKGNLYGTTSDGGAYSYGTVFKVTPEGKETVLHSFKDDGTDGVEPYAGVIIDQTGNLYGTTSYGGTIDDYGTVFKVTPSGEYTILYNFGGSGDGIYPNALALDSKGNLYGTTFQGGAYGVGTVFELTPSGTETVIWSFGLGTDGAYPGNGMIPVLDTEGNLYGTTPNGGAYNAGTVFKLTPSGAETILYSFNPQGNAPNGESPRSGVILDAEGNLYGTTPGGGAYCVPENNCGTVFELTPTGTETVLHSFGASGDGFDPWGGLVSDGKGNLYGTTIEGGAYGYGAVIKLTR
jgi:uncharacterized repeat protein (TIGR03803 family)